MNKKRLDRYNSIVKKINRYLAENSDSKDTELLKRKIQRFHNCNHRLFNTINRNKFYFGKFKRFPWYRKIKCLFGWHEYGSGFNKRFSDQPTDPFEFMVGIGSIFFAKYGGRIVEKYDADQRCLFCDKKTTVTFME